MSHNFIYKVGGVFLIFSIAVFAGEEPGHSLKKSENKQPQSSHVESSATLDKWFSTINYKVDTLIENSSHDRELTKLTQEINALKTGASNSNSYQLVNEKIRGLKNEHSIIFNVMTILISMIAIFGIGGAVYSLWGPTP